MATIIPFTPKIRPIDASLICHSDFQKMGNNLNTRKKQVVKRVQSRMNFIKTISFQGGNDVIPASLAFISFFMALADGKKATIHNPAIMLLMPSIQNNNW